MNFKFRNPEWQQHDVLVRYQIFEADKIYKTHEVGIWAESELEDEIKTISGVLHVEVGTNQGDKEKCWPNYYKLVIDPRYSSEKICYQIKKIVKLIKKGE